jgi:hypothetical protein
MSQTDSVFPVVRSDDVPKGMVLIGVPIAIEMAHGEIIRTARHVLRYGKLGKQSERRLREALKALDEAVPS